jgi:hypothetical protein
MLFTVSTMPMSNFIISIKTSKYGFSRFDLWEIDIPPVNRMVSGGGGLVCLDSTLYYYSTIVLMFRNSLLHVTRLRDAQY